MTILTDDDDKRRRQTTYDDIRQTTTNDDKCQQPLLVSPYTMCRQASNKYDTALTTQVNRDYSSITRGKS